jgi:hypothetical protein
LDQDTSPNDITVAPPPAQTDASGVLVVTSTPSGATVRLNGADRGTTPLTLSALDPGRYTLDVQADAYRPVRTTVSVVAGDTIRLMPTLPPRSAVITLRVIPYGSIAIDGTARLDDSDMAFTDSLAAGTYRLQATYRDLEWIRTVTLAPGEIYRRVVDFTQTIPVGVTVRTAAGDRVPNAEVVVDGESRGYAPLQLMLRVGTHTLTVLKDGYAPGERTVTVDEELEAPLVFDLTPRS